MSQLLHDTAQLRSLLHLASRLGDATTSAQVARIVLDEFAHAIGAVRCAVYEWVPGEPDLRLLDSVGLPAGVETLRARISPTAALPLACAVRERRVLWLASHAELIATFPELAHAAARAGEVQSLVAMPLTSRDQVVGGIALSFAQQRPFDDMQRAFVTAIADLCAQAIDRAQLFERERASRETAERVAAQTRALELAARMFSAALTVTEVGEAVLACATSVLRADTAGLWLVDDGGTELRRVQARGLAPPLEEASRVLRVDGPAPVAATFRTGQPEWLCDRASYAERFPASAEHIDARGAPADYAAACLPLRLEGRALGCMFYGFDRARGFDHAERAFLQLLAQHAAQAIDRARLFQEQRAARTVAEAQEQHLRKLQAITVALASAPTTQEVAAIVADEARELLGAQFAAVAIGVSADRVRVVVSDGRSAGLARPFVEGDATRATPIAIAYRTRQVLVAEDREALARLAPAACAWGDTVVAALAAPIPGEPGVRGALGLGFERPRAFSAKDRAFLVDLANLASLALARARLFESEADARKTAESALLRAQLADRRKDEFLAILGHELRNPLAPILTATELMKLGAVDEQRVRGVIERQVRHMMQLVDDLLDVSRITRGHVELARAPVDLAAAVGKAVEQASPLLERKAQRLVVDVPEGTCRVLGDTTRLGQVFGNLLQNAAKYSGSGTEIRVTARVDGDDVVATVRDQGIGIERELLPHIFDLFMQAPQAIARSQGGLGLGLAIVKKLVDMHGGTVAARSDGPGRGSELEVRLPRHVDGAAIEPARRSPRALRATEPRLNVLVVDDNREAAEMLAELLGSAGYTARAVFDGPAALQAAAAAPPDVALIDIGLPVMDGYELCRRFGTLPSPPRVIVALTGYGTPTDAARAREAGFHEHLVKPVGLDRIEGTIASLLPAATA